MRLCLDANVLVSLFSTDGHTTPAKAIISHGGWSAAGVSEFASAIARRVRAQDLTAEEPRTNFQAFEAWGGAVCDQVTVPRKDVALADAMIGRSDLGCHAPDAIHLALMDRPGVTIATFDRGMAVAAGALATPAVPA